MLMLVCVMLACTDSQMDATLDAICQVESGGNPSALGDSGLAVGAYQIHEIFVREVNRISGKKFTYEDRLDPVKSRAMARIFLEHQLRRGLTLRQAVAKYNNGKNKSAYADKVFSTIKERDKNGNTNK